jgi:hypothetical protein
MDVNSIHGKDELGKESDSFKTVERDEKIVKELLKKVKKRRKLVRSYMNFAWFSIFFACFVGNLYMKAVSTQNLISHIS